MKKIINYSIGTAKVYGKVYYSFYDIINVLGIDSQTACIQLGCHKPIRIICVEDDPNACVNSYVLYDDLVKLIAFGNKVNPTDIKLYSSDIPLKDIETDQLKVVISVELPSKENGQMPGVTFLSDKAYSTMDIAKDYRLDICFLNRYLEYRNVQYLEKNKYHLYDRYSGKGLVVDMPTMKYLRWTEKGKKFIEYMLKQDGYKKVVRKHG